MSSQTRNLEKRILRAKGLMAPRRSPRATTKGQPYRHCLLKKDENGAIVSWKRFR